MNDLWNLAAALGGPPNTNATYFGCSNVKAPWWRKADRVLDMGIDMMTQKKDINW